MSPKGVTREALEEQAVDIARVQARIRVLNGWEELPVEGIVALLMTNEYSPPMVKDDAIRGSINDNWAHTVRDRVLTFLEQPQLVWSRCPSCRN